MSSLNTAPFDCPTLQQLSVDGSSVDTQSWCPLGEANKWLSAFKASVSKCELEPLLSLFHEQGFWKDILTLTWDFRTIRGHPAILRMLEARLAVTGLSAFRLLEDAIRGPTIVKPLPDLMFIRFCFDLETTHGKGTAVAFLIPMSGGGWKAWSLFTCLRALKAYPEKIGALRARLTAHDNWQGRRRREINFEDGDPAVLVIGAGHSGLQTAARLTYLGVPTLVVERNQRIGDNWRKQYKSLWLQNSIWFNQMPYLEYPKTFPVFCPAYKLGDWLESYAKALDVNVWLSSSIISTSFNQEKRTWQVSIDRDGNTRTMTVNHLVFATGWGGGLPKMPDISGKELYQGAVLHSTQFTSPEEYQGKKVIIVGSGTSAHDIAHVLRHEECDVTMIQRSSTYVLSRDALESFSAETYNEHFPIDFADILNTALPYPTQKCLWKAATTHTANGRDKEILGSLARVGFQTSLGPDGAGWQQLLYDKGRGPYIDTGTCKEIINGSIKVKNSPIL
ncbi:hypothetical protein JVU11DRAFT_12074 [Chiua virens]|nr:hypothetical protein JVU11DRAFT_12074 [Chiua virens]